MTIFLGADFGNAYETLHVDPAAESWLTEGEEIMGWKVHSIDSAGAKLQKDGRDIELQVYARQ